MSKQAYGTGWIERHGKHYRARLWRDGRAATLGTFATEDEAEAVLRAAAEAEGLEASAEGAAK